MHPESPSRRGFLQTVGAAAVAAASPTILRATDKAGTTLPTVTAGAHTYEVHHDWGQVPVGLKYGNTHGVVEDAQGHIYVHHTVAKDSAQHDTMVVFDDKGRFVRSWGREFEGGAHGLHIEKEGRQQFLYLCDTKRAIVTKRTLTGEEVWTIGYPKESPQYAPGADGKPIKYSPTNVAVAPNGDVYVGDGYGSSFINQYTKDGDVHPHLRRQGQGRGSARLSARPHRRPPRLHADAGRGRSRQQAAPDLLARRQAPGVRRGRDRAVSLLRAQGPDGRPRPLRPRHAPRPAEPDRRAPRRGGHRFVEADPRRRRAKASRSASSSARTAPASITTGTSSSPSGWRSAGVTKLQRK